MLASTRPDRSSRQHSQDLPTSSKLPVHRHSSPPPDDHATAHATASLAGDSALDHLMSALHLDHSSSALPPLFPTASPAAVRAHLAAMGYNQVPHETLAAIIDDLNGHSLASSDTMTSTASPPRSQSRRRRKRAQVTIHDESYISAANEFSDDDAVVDLTTLDDLALSAPGAAGSFETSTVADTTAVTTLTRPELETYLLDMGYAPSDLDTALVDDLLEALNESVMMGQETMMSMLRADGDGRVEQGQEKFSRAVMTGEEADRTLGGGHSQEDHRAGEVHWATDGNDETGRVEERAADDDEHHHQQQGNHSRGSATQRSWSPTPSSSSTSSYSRTYKATTSYPPSSFRTFRPPPIAQRNPANDPVLRYHQYARAWSASPFLVRREREAGNAGASVWSLPSSTAAAAAAAPAGPTIMSHSRMSSKGTDARQPPKWDDSLDQSCASSDGRGFVDKDRDVWAVRDWIKAPSAATETRMGSSGGRRTPASTR